MYFAIEYRKSTIEKTDSGFEREPLIRPFGFKGGYMTEIWQTIAWLQSGSGIGTMESYHPYADAEWRKTKNGVFITDGDFYAKSGGVLTDSDHYRAMFQ